MLAKLVYRYRNILFFFISLLTLFSLSRLHLVEINQDFAKLYPSDSTDYQFFSELSDSLGNENKSLLIGIKRKNGIFDSLHLLRVLQFTYACDTLPFVANASSLLTIQDPYDSPFGIIGFPFVTHENVANFKNDSLLMVNDDRVMNRFISKDFKTLVVSVQVEKLLDGVEAEELISNLESLLEVYDFEEAHIAGTNYTMVNSNRIINWELIRIFIIMVLFLVIFLGWLYQSLLGFFVPFITYLVGIINTLGYITIIGHELSTVSNLILPSLLIVTLSDVIHLINRYEENLEVCKDKKEALVRAIHESGTAIFLTSAVIAFGFLTFTTSSVPANSEFGLDMAVGVMLCFIVTICIMPAVLSWLKENRIQSNRIYRQGWSVTADLIYKAVRSYPTFIFLIFSLLILAGFLSIGRIDTNAKLLGTWSPDQPLEKSLVFFEKNLSGVRSIDIAVLPKKDRTLGELELLREIEKVHNYLDSLPELGGVYSPVSYFKSFSKTMDVEHKNYALPPSQEILDTEERIIKVQTGLQYNTVLNESKAMGKITARLTDFGKDEVAKINDKVMKWINTQTDTSFLSYRLTGQSYIIDRGHEYAIYNMAKGLVISFLAVVLVLLIVFRDPIIVAIIFLVNITPVFLAVILMSSLKSPLDSSTSVIFNLVFILALDDTIHYMTLYKQLRQNGWEKTRAVKVMHRQTGKAMLLTTILVLGGFSSTLFSDIAPTFSVGLMTMYSSIAALLTDFFLAPCLLLKFEK